MAVSDFMQALTEYRQMTDAFLDAARGQFEVGPEHLADAVFSYLSRPAKRLRPALLLMCCQAAGGDAERALPAAAAVELFHTWTLVHDDIIDNDSTRRGGPTAHVEAAAAGKESFGLDATTADRYGRDVAILAGDIQQGWATSLLTQCAERGVRLEVVLSLIREMTGVLNPRLIQGEMLDVQLAHRSINTVCEDDLMQMMRLKTGALLAYAASAGAAIGSDCPADESAIARNLGHFAEQCGIAFQLQDDILGITGDEAALGKPIGSDIREGKVTLPVLQVLANGKESCRELLLATLGDRSADEEQVKRAGRCLVDEGGVAYARTVAARLLREAMALLDDSLPPSRQRTLLRGWAEFMIERSF